MTPAMPTLRTLLETANGLYRDSTVNEEYPRSALMAHLAPDVLELPVKLAKVGDGTYTVRLVDGDDGFVLYSRRRAPRPS